MIAIDTNLLIYAHRGGSPQHDEARAVLAKVLEDPRGWGICSPTIAEFWSIVTHPEIPGGPSSSAVVTHFFHSLITEGRGAIWAPGPGFGERLMRWASSLKVRGKRIFDLQIAVVALEHGAQEIWTHDQRFATVPGVRVHNPIGPAKEKR